MDFLQQLSRITRQGAAILQEVKASGMTKQELAVFLDCSYAHASMLLAVSEALTAADLAVAGKLGYSLDRLRELSGLAKRLKNPEVDVVKLRHTLIQECADLNHHDLRMHIRRVIAELNEGYVPTRAWYVRYSGAEDPDGMKYMIAKMPAPVIQRIQALLTPRARHLAAMGTAVSEAEGHAMALAAAVLDQPLHDAAAHPMDLRHRPCFLIPVNDAHLLETGEIVNSDGSIMDLREIVDHEVAKMGFAVVCGRDSEGTPRPIKAFEIQRLADAEQRFLSIISYLVCQRASCDVPAVRCEIHHIQAFSKGGKTVLGNLCPLCRRHNRENDDDPAKPRHGRIIKDPKTKMIWYQDNLGQRQKNLHRAQEFNGMSVAARMLN
ncbi:HNH endonuclease [Corynebacterium sp. HS2168-gen11]|uniref:HNH endonuclease n=1 Tax=Corynebacterium sp. HS2168-gen11 TaxID=2974027 RepID=UPI00216B32F9|nr:HNH endonuclease signature motif containing protein [Corynebacterium sp. HS2168-gen11]MCS4535548.1 HNH endonuclease [Corynebacterium sp. HS2168-gen11]